MARGRGGGGGGGGGVDASKLDLLHSFPLLPVKKIRLAGYATS